ncbi:MAG TPA: 1,6-anhydro-N-acetylmuramyl-L-alanine amidase AmpD [Mariprofundaceae bacterium]|nr:1,6-anhydro-N-acetylmuramyl-L-alanine amidase AmpD [Mariprofundaceae bacterium]
MAIKPIPFLASPHFNARPDMPINLIVLHAISLPDGKFSPDHITDFFLDNIDISAHPSFKDLKNVKVSSHFVVARDGSITQFVPTEKRAWHAGKSSWENRENCNDYSIGIEMIGDERQPFTRKQYTETARLCRTLITQYPIIDKTRIVGHQDIAPTRKWDPGKQWDWSHFRRSFAHIKHLHPTLKT